MCTFEASDDCFQDRSHLETVIREGTVQLNRQRIRYELNRIKWQPYVSAILVIINVIVYLICRTRSGDILYRKGILNVVDVLLQKEYGRLIWSMFLHSDIHHLFNNMLILFFLGGMIEREIGHIQYASLYFLSGIGGNVLSLASKVINNNYAGSLGASGAVFGLDGVLLSMVLFSRGELRNVTPGRVVIMIVLSLYSGFTGSNIDNAGHVGGLLTGFLLGSVLCIFQRRRREKNG